MLSGFLRGHSNLSGPKRGKAMDPEMDKESGARPPPVGPLDAGAGSSLR
eukprot:CAMPEP_0184234766 /NCGR_PEP_ID=MMETSP0976-20121227/24977_1 /TAXON_ID=483370 /ORGANISM="non described non described, Strain CCMP2097" /LENGTH=48 /DNA_ID= /DNA_START= /DNA_END= /DNA_ORIENTATION=